MAPQQEQKLTADELSDPDTAPSVMPAWGAQREEGVRCCWSRENFYSSPTLACSVISNSSLPRVLAAVIRYKVTKYSAKQAPQKKKKKEMFPNRNSVAVN